MKVRLEDAGPCRKVMHVHAPAEEVAAEYGNVVKAFASFARVPGFRPGKAPAGVVERHYEKNIAEEARERLIPRLYRAAIGEKEVNPVSIVDVRDVSFAKNTGIEFNVTLDVAPDFKLPRYRKITIQGKDVKVEEKDIDEALERLLDNFSKFEDVTDRAARRGDLVKIDYSGEMDGKQLRELAVEPQGIADGKDFWALVGEPEFLPGFAAALDGMKIGEQKQVTVAFPAEFHVARLAGRTARYGVTITSIREKITPSLDAEFLKKLQVGSESALREKMRTSMAEQAEKMEKDRLKNEIAKALLAETTFDLPQSIVAQETSAIIRNMVERASGQGVNASELDKRRDEIFGYATRTSKDRVKLSYILSRIADEEKVTVEDAEIDKRIAEMAAEYGMQTERLKAELEKKNELETIKSEIRAGKTMDILLRNVKIRK